jgi:hypothetical protein
MMANFDHDAGMILSQLFERYIGRAPISMMARALMESALAPEELDALFERTAEQQYSRTLMFSAIVDLMGVVVSKSRPSICAAFKDKKEEIGVSLPAVYDKLKGIETAVTSEFVSHTSQKLRAVVESMEGELPPIINGYRVKIIDGNHLAATERRLRVLKRSKAGPLPGHSLVVLDPQLMLATDMIPCEDAHAQERSLTPEILERVSEGEVWIADRNFCTASLLFGIAQRNAFFVIRQHAKLRVEPAGALKSCGRTDTGEVFEQPVNLTNSEGAVVKVRRVVIRLDSPTRDGDREMAILTNLSKTKATATTVANAYRKRWKVETMFQALTQMLQGEIDTLAYPKAALFGFGIALVTYNILSTVQSALRAKYGAEKIQEEVSLYYVALEVQGAQQGMDIVFEPSDWTPVQEMTPKSLGRFLLRCAANVDLSKYRRQPRGPKKPVPKRTRFVDQPHVSTKRLLDESRKSRKK